MKRLVNCGPVVGILAALVLVGCQPAPPAGPAPNQVQVCIDWGVGMKITRAFVTITGRPTVLQVTREIAPVATEVTDTGEEWVVGIAARMADVDAGTLWSYELNNEAPTTAPNLRHVKPGDVIFWRMR